MRVEIYLIESPDGRPLFYSDESRARSEPAPTHTGIRGWVERRAARLKAIGQSGDGALAVRIRGLSEWVRRHTPADEPMLVRLRHAPHIHIHHSPQMTTDDARDRWRTYLSNRWRRHFLWFSVHALLSPLSLLLAPLPGPNVVGYWFGYRALRHLLALLGVRKASEGATGTTFQPHRGLDRPAEDRSVAPNHEAIGVDEAGLLEFLERSGVAQAERMSEQETGAGRC